MGVLLNDILTLRLWIQISQYVEEKKYVQAILDEVNASSVNTVA